MKHELLIFDILLALTLIFFVMRELKRAAPYVHMVYIFLFTVWIVPSLVLLTIASVPIVAVRNIKEAWLRAKLFSLKIIEERLEREKGKA